VIVVHNMTSDTCFATGDDKLTNTDNLRQELFEIILVFYVLTNIYLLYQGCVCVPLFHNPRKTDESRRASAALGALEC